MLFIYKSTQASLERRHSWHSTEDLTQVATNRAR